MNEDELFAVHPNVLLTDERYQALRQWVSRHYRDELRPDDLLDPMLPREVDTAFDELGRILALPLNEISPRC